MSRLPLALLASLLIAGAPLSHAQNPSSSSDMYQPRDFQADAAIRAKVEDAIESAAGRDANRIVVDVRHGHVYLTGKVRDAQTRAIAHDAARAVPGVTDVTVRKLFASRY